MDGETDAWLALPPSLCSAVLVPLSRCEKRLLLFRLVFAFVFLDLDLRRESFRSGVSTTADEGLSRPKASTASTRALKAARSEELTDDLCETRREMRFDFRLRSLIRLRGVLRSPLLISLLLLSNLLLLLLLSNN